MVKKGEPGMWQHSHLFRDRADAGRQLADALVHHKDESPLVLALPRGGVPVGFEVAKHLDAQLDVLLVRKIGVPGHEELALGAVVDGADPQVVVNDNVMAMAAPPAGYLEAAKARELKEIERRRHAYRGDQPAIAVKDRVVIVVDDGIATGATMRAALKGVRQAGPARLVLAVPVAPAETVEELKRECDEVVCLQTPEPFYAVGLHYADFGQTADEEVVNLLAKAQRLEEGPHHHPPGTRPAGEGDTWPPVR
jgi:putative phosphoribosyl transferase